MTRTIVVSLALLSISTAPGLAQPSLQPTKATGPHKITDKQIDKIRQADVQRTAAASASVPGSSRGQEIETSDRLEELLSRMSRRDRRAIFGRATTPTDSDEIDDLLAKAKGVVFLELEVRETDPNLPLIDVDGDGVLDQVDAIRYSGPELKNHRLCGPTIVMRRRQRLVIHLKNYLKESREPVVEWIPGNEPPEPPEPPAYWMMDAPHDLFSTNIHTHGLHVCPGGGHDNAFLDLEPATGDEPNEMFLDYELPGNHVAGTFWYHAHRHGSVAYQLANGMAGALIVLGSDRPNSTDLESIPEIRAANYIKHPVDSAKDVDYGRVMLLQQLVFTKATTENGQSRWIVDPADLNDRKVAPTEKNVGRITEGIPANKPESAEVLAVNGQNVPTIDIQRGEIERWRLIHAGRESALNLAWYKAADLKDSAVEAPEITDAIESYEIATDGIPTGRLTRLKSTDLYPGYRCDVLVRVTDKAEDGEYWLLPSEARRLTKTHLGPVQNSTPAAKLMVRGQLDRPMRLPSSAQLERLRRPPPDMTDAQTLNLNFTFADKERFGVATVAHGPGKPYAESGSAESITMMIDTPQIWNLGVHEFLPGVAEAIKHPFHMHVNPFYVPSLGVWKDTIAIDREQVTPIHFVPTDFAGRSVLHCHILDHEDQGMMKDILIVGNRRSQYPDLFQLDRLSANERCTFPDLDLEPGKNNVLVFIAGTGCPHCVQGVVRLWKRSEPLKNLNATIKCMSATPIEKKSLISFGLRKKDHFTFQQVPDNFNLSQTAFAPSPPTLIPTSSAVSDPTPESNVTHGVLIFDKDQNLRFRHLGNKPLNDLDEITYALMELQESELNSPGAPRRRWNPR